MDFSRRIFRLDEYRHCGRRMAVVVVYILDNSGSSDNWMATLGWLIQLPRQEII
jgi:hypothetical protein